MAINFGLQDPKKLLASAYGGGTNPPPIVENIDPNQEPFVKSYSSPISTPVANTLKMDNNVSNPILDNSIAPVVPLNTTNIKTQAATIQAQVAQIQAQLDAAKKAGYADNEEIKYDASGNPIPKGTEPTTPDPKEPSAPDEPSWVQKIIGLFKSSQEQIAALPKTPSLDEATNSILSKFGYTPESFQQVSALTTELGAINKEIANLETQKNLALERIENRPGMSLEFMSGEQRRVAREYAIQEAGLGGKAAAINAQVSALTGAYDKAEEAARDYVALATAERRQAISDIQYSMNFYADVYSKMEESDRKRVNDLLDAQNAQLQLEERKAQNDINNMIRLQGLDLQKQGLEIREQLADLKISTGGGGGGGTYLGDLTKDQRTYLNTIQDNARQNPDIKIFSDVRAAFEQARSAASKGTGAGDITLMRTIAKITDPASSVREEEFATFKGAQSALQKYGVAITKQWWQGSQLSEYGRSQLLTIAEDLYNQRKTAYDNAWKFYDEQATAANIPSGKVTPYAIAPDNNQKKVQVTDADANAILNQVSGAPAPVKKENKYGLLGNLWNWITGK